MKKHWLAALALCLCLPLSSAYAQDEFGDETGGDPELGDTNNETPVEGGEGEGGLTADQHAPADGAARLAQTRTKDQWLVGLQWRQLIIPAFIQQIFLDEAPTVFQPGFSLVATKRNDENFSLVFGLGYTSYAFDGLYRAKGDPIQDTEMLDSNLGLIHGTVSALWAANINEYLDFEYGIGGEIGVVTGRLKRSEAYKRGGSWGTCSGPGNPPDLVLPEDRLSSSDPVGIPYCNGPSVAYDEDGEHYNVTEERIPPVFLLPTLLHLGLRITPIPEVAIKVEAGYATLAFWFGASLHLNITQLQ